MRLPALSFCLLLVATLAACTSLDVPEPVVPAPDAPVWDDGELREHLRFFNTAEVGGRGTGTSGYARAAAYLAARLGEFHLQPVLDGEYRVVYGTPLNVPRSAFVASVGRDSTVYRPGLHYLPGGRTDSGRVQVTALSFIDPSQPLPPRFGAGEAVAVAAGAAGDSLITALGAAGAPVVVVIGAMAPVVAPTPVPGLLLLHATPPTVDAWLGEPATPLLASGATRSLPRPVVARVATDRQVQAGALNVLGYVAGKHPVHARDLVLVCADLDALGSFGGIPILDYEHFGTGTAALLELARNFGTATRHWPWPDRTLLFAVWSGGRLGQAGLKAYLRQPVWPLDRTRAVVYVGLRPEDERAVRALLAPLGVALVVVPLPAEPLAPQRSQAMLEENNGRRRGASRPSDAFAAVLERAIEQARTLAEAAYPELSRLSNASGE